MNWSTLFEIIGYGGYLIVGGLAFYGLFDTKNKGRADENRDIADNLIKNLTLTVEAEQRKREKMETDMKEHTEKRDKEVSQLRDELNHMKGRNSILEELFKGRNPMMDEVFKQAPEVFRIARENNQMSKSNNEAISKLTATIEEFINKLPPLTPTIRP